MHLAIAARDALEAEGVADRRRLPALLGDSSPRRTTSYRDQVLGSALRVGIEAAVGFGWERWLGADGIFIGMGGFGASAPAEELFRHFGITAGGGRRRR